MSLVAMDADGFRRVIDALQAGLPVALPPPSPITYGLAATTPAAVNEAKGRPPGQPVALGLTSLDVVRPDLRLDPRYHGLVEWLIFAEMLTVLIPVAEDAPEYLSPAVVNGYALVAGAWLPETLPVVTSAEHLYLSSGNATSGNPAWTAREADRTFEGRLLVLNGDALRRASGQHGSTTMVRVGSDGELAFVRAGIQDALTAGGDAPAYLEDLRRRHAQACTSDSKEVPGPHRGEPSRQAEVPPRSQPLQSW
jgi:tRNA A37 threonylcarbamoyladenosine synthetase subunit TsaC/SUA5/YrdC